MKEKRISENCTSIKLLLLKEWGTLKKSGNDVIKTKETWIRHFCFSQVAE